MTEQQGPLTGHRLGNYLLLDLLNVGGMAEVYRGRDATDNRDVAVKVLPPALAADPQYVERFKYEAALVGKLAHPNIVPIERYGEEGPYLYLVMPLLDGSLRDLLNRGERIHPADTVFVGIQIASALAAVHALGLIHRDVKPDNILFSKGRVLLTDFGITRRIEAERTGKAPTLAGTGLPVGTPQYMAPEQLDGQQHVDHRADLYALGAVLYELLTGRPPHVADGPYAVAARVLHDPIQPPSQLNPALWPELDAVVMRALARDPADRYANAASMRDALQRVDQQYRSDMTISRRRTGDSEVTTALPRSTLPVAPESSPPPSALVFPALPAMESASLPTAPQPVPRPAAPPPTPQSSWQGAKRDANGGATSGVGADGSASSGVRSSGGQGSGWGTAGGASSFGASGSSGSGGGNGGNIGGDAPARRDDDDHRRTPPPALLVAIAAVLLAVSVFCGASLFINHSANPNAQKTPTSGFASDPTYESMAATATVLEQTPTVTTGLNTPTPTPRPPLPTRTPTTIPSATPTKTPTVAPTATFTPVPPTLSVTPSPASFQCGLDVNVQLTVQNIGTGTLTWSAHAYNDLGLVSVNPDTDSLGAGQPEFVTVSGLSILNDFDVQFDSNGGSPSVHFHCT